ncbi:hypothetical protein C5B38_08665, partial [Neisseria gonorrhoeae]
MPSEAVSARPLCEYLLHLAIRPFLLTLMLTYTPVSYSHLTLPTTPPVYTSVVAVSFTITATRCCTRCC